MTTTPTLQMLAPADLIIDTNVRLDPQTDRSFVANIKQHGVLQPIVARADEQGQVHVRMGQRRTLAACEAALPSVPVMVLPAETSDDEATRIIEQLAENDHREGLTDKDRAVAVEALTGLGLSAAQIQRRTNRPKAEVAAAITVNESTTARAAVDAATLTLEQGATLAEFEDDEDAVTSLMEAAAAEGRGFEHKAQQLRDERTRDALYNTKAEELTAQGLTVIVPPSYYDEGEHPDAARLSALVNADDRSDLTTENHAECPGHAAAVRVDSRWNHDEGQNKWVTTVQHYCTNPHTNGHVDRYASGNSGKKRAEDMTETEREEAKAERREVIDNNKAWTSAETTRRDWITKFLTRKTAPKDAAPFLATALANGAGSADIGHHGVREVLTALGVDPSREAAAKATTGRAMVLVLARVLAAYERQTDRSDWRRPSTSTRDYLTFLAAQGYDLSEVEQRATTTD